jgi:pyrroline-5-carboxylate reductase
MMGLPRSEALELAAQSEFSLSRLWERRTIANGHRNTAMQGAARMVLQTGMHPAALKDSVTSAFASALPRLVRLV